MPRSLRPLFDDVERADLQFSSIEVASEPSAAGDDGEGGQPRHSPERRRSMKLQGAYVGQLRNLTAPEKERVRTLRARKGVEAAIALAKKLAKR